MKEDGKSRAQILGENLERIRKAKGYSRKQFAEMFGAGVDLIGLYENGKRLPPLDKIFRLANLLDVSITDLTGDNPNAEINKRYQKALDIAELIFIFEPKIDEDGRITVYSSTKTEYNTDGSVSHFHGYNAIAFKNKEDFINVMEQAERIALYKSFNEAFRDIVFEKN